jgi:hypothetical protein
MKSLVNSPNTRPVSGSTYPRIEGLTKLDALSPIPPSQLESRNDPQLDSGSTRQSTSLAPSPRINRDKPAQSPQTQGLASDEHVSEFLLPPSHIQIAPEHHNVTLDEGPDINLTTLDRKHYICSPTIRNLRLTSLSSSVTCGDDITYIVCRSRNL